MNSKKYMDFMPATEKTPAKRVTQRVAKKPASRSLSSTSTSTSTSTTKKPAIPAAPKKLAKPAPSVTHKPTPAKPAPSATHRPTPAEPDVEKIMRPREIKPRAGVSTGTMKSAGTMRLPTAQFVNTAKVEKRPLSKTVYQKATPAKTTVAAETVTIIDKPDRDSRAGIVIAIIITIFLGAAAGTVAFLLLPK